MPRGGRRGFFLFLILMFLSFDFIKIKRCYFLGVRLWVFHLIIWIWYCDVSRKYQFISITTLHCSSIFRIGERRDDIYRLLLLSSNEILNLSSTRPPPSQVHSQVTPILVSEVEMGASEQVLVPEVEESLSHKSSVSGDHVLGNIPRIVSSPSYYSPSGHYQEF